MAIYLGCPCVEVRKKFSIVKDIMLYGVKEGYFTEAVVDDLVNLYLDALKGLTMVAMKEKYRNND